MTISGFGRSDLEPERRLLRDDFVFGRSIGRFGSLLSGTSMIGICSMIGVKRVYVVVVVSHNRGCYVSMHDKEFVGMSGKRSPRSEQHTRTRHPAS